MIPTIMLSTFLQNLYAKRTYWTIFPIDLISTWKNMWIDWISFQYLHIGCLILQSESWSLSSFMIIFHDSYPFFTILGQSIGSQLVAMECVLRYPPHLFVDSVGFSFTLMVVKLLSKARTAAYIHYPTISTVFPFFLFPLSHLNKLPING